MNRPEPRFRGGPGQREVQEKAAKLRAAVSSSGASPSLPARAGEQSSVVSGSRGSGAREASREARDIGEARTKPRPDKGGSRRVAKSSPRVGGYEAPDSSGGFRRASRRVPLTLLKNITGLFLLPIAWVWTISFAGVFSKATVHQRFWMTEDFWFFVLGVGTWLVAFTGGLYLRGEPPLLRMYVRVHEYTHAIWTWLSNGKVGEIKINHDHGHILTDKPTVLVTLAPYFYPLPCVLLIMVFLVIQLVYPLDQAPPMQLPFGNVSPVAVFVLLMGMGWGFHFSYTVWMIRKGQSDLRMHGNFFSLVVIYLVNLFVVTVFLILMAAGVEWRVFGRALLVNAEEFSEAAWMILVKLWEAAKSGALPAAR